LEVPLPPFGTLPERFLPRVTIWFGTPGKTVRNSFVAAESSSHLLEVEPLRFTSQASRLLFGLVTPVAVLVAASVFAGVTEGCTREETSPTGSLVGAPEVEGRGSASVTQPRARELSARTLSNTAGFLGGAANGVGSQAGTPLEQLLGGTAPLVVRGRAGDSPTTYLPSTYNGLCPPDMASIDDRFCVDRYEASLLEVLPDGSEKAFSPYQSVAGHVVRAISEAGVFPQGYISEVQAIQACGLSGKRLCKAKEWRQACMGPTHKRYGYADKSAPGKCNDHGRSPMIALYANENLSKRDKWDWERMNRPELNQFEGTLAHTGEHDECTNDYGVYDMVGNLHEWVDDPNGTFQGGYYQDTTLNGEGCQYVTSAHEARYHDYSTGFRCCEDVAP
jgi:sulfatase modifying factor 1